MVNVASGIPSGVGSFAPGVENGPSTCWGLLYEGRLAR